MDTNELIRKLAEFLEKEHYAELLEKIRKGEKHLIVDFQKIIEFEPELGDLILDQPEETIKAFELAVEHLSEKGKGFVIRIKNLTDSARIMVRNIRSVHLGKLFFIEGIVRQKSDVRPQVTNAKFECPSCGNTIAVLQLDTKFKEPNKCSCGRQGKFRLLSKELIDAQGLVLEEVPEQLEGGEQPKRISIFLKNDLVSPLSDKKTNPGSRILVVGTLKEVPIITKTGGQSTRFDLIFEANYFEPIEEDFSEVTISEEDRKKIKELAADQNLTKRLVNSIAPTIYGHEKIKESLMLQLLGGVRKIRDDASVTRGDIHILLVGDPGCIAGNSQVALFTKGMDKIKNLGSKHLQPIREVITKIRKDGKDKGYDFATLFQHYPQQAVLKVVTETGKEITCTYNQPLLTKQGWKRADEIKQKTEIRVLPKIPNNVKKPVQTNFIKVEKTTGKLKEINLPDKYTPELAALCGYIIGDGSVNKKGYSITCYVNESEKDLIEKLVNLWKKTFNVNARISVSESNGKKTIREKGISREIISKQHIHIIEVNSRQINNSLSFLANKRVPQEIFKSPKKTIAEFISWLFEADECSFGKGRGRTSIQLKSRTSELLKDVQMLLLYFGIQSRIIEDNLCIRRSRDIEIFAKNIGFKSEKKKKKIEETLNEVKKKSQTQKRKTLQRYEKVVKITPAGVMDVYDFEVPLSHMFVANGIVCHNSGKSMLLKRIGKVSPKGRFVSGKGASGAGLCVAEDSLVMTNPGEIHQIKEIVENNLKKGEKEQFPGIFKSKIKTNERTFSLNEEGKIETNQIDSYWRIKAPENLVKIKTQSGKEIKTTKNTKLFTLEKGKIICKEASEFKEGEYLATARKIPEIEKQKEVHLLNLVSSSPTILGVKNNVKEIVGKLSKKYKTVRNLAKKLEINENNLYHNWVNNQARGNVDLVTFKKLINEAKYSFSKIKNFEVSLYKGRKIKLPEKINKKLLYFAGLVAGDGDLSKGKNTTTIRFSSNNKNLLNIFEKVSKELFNVKVGVSSEKSEKRPASLRFSSKIVAEVLHKLGIPPSPKSNLINPSNIILQMPNGYIAEFLKGLFDCDGSVVKRKSKGASYIDFTTTSKELARKVQLLLLRFGISSKLRIREANSNWKIKSRYDKYVIEIKGKENLVKFKQRINFVHETKNKKLNQIITKTGKANTNIDIVPNIQKDIIDLIKKHKIKSRKIFGYKKSSSTLFQSQISRSYLKKIVRKIEKLVKNDEWLKNLKSLAFGDLFWEKIVEKETVKNEKEYVYDFTVKKHHNFLVNGIVVHNTATVVRDEFLQGWSLEAGALVLANRGVCAIDELDKMSPDDTAAMHEALEGQTITISKANIQATLRCETTVLAAANPKFGRFDPYGTIASQINLPVTLINRFDLIFPIKDLPNQTNDEKMAKFILELHKEGGRKEQDIDNDLLRKYFAYARTNIKPKLTSQAIDEIKEYYLKMRASATTGEGIRSIPISARQLEALVRLSEAYAKIHLSDKVGKKDAKKAVEMLDYCLRQVAFDEETGTIDIDRIATEMPATQRNKILTIKEVINDLEGKLGKTIPLEDVIRSAAEKGIDEAEVEEIIQKLKRAGDIYEPKHGFVSKI